VVGAKGIEACAVVIEQTGSAYEIRAFAAGLGKILPQCLKGFLARRQGLQFAIGTVAKDGNRSFIEGKLHNGEGAMNRSRSSRFPRLRASRATWRTRVFVTRARRRRNANSMWFFSGKDMP